MSFATSSLHLNICEVKVESKQEIWLLNRMENLKNSEDKNFQS